MTWELTAMFAGATTFSSEVEWYRLEDEVLRVRTVGLENRLVDGRCIGVIAIPKRPARTLEELPPR